MGVIWQRVCGNDKCHDEAGQLPVLHDDHTRSTRPRQPQPVLFAGGIAAGHARVRDSSRDPHTDIYPEVQYGPLNYRTAARTLFLRPYLVHFCSVFRRFFAVFSVLTPGFQKAAPKDRGRFRNGRKRPRKEWSPPTYSWWIGTANQRTSSRHRTLPAPRARPRTLWRLWRSAPAREYTARSESCTR